MGVALLAPGWVLTDNVRRMIDSSPEWERAIQPYAQPPEMIAAQAFEGLLAGHTVIAPNPASRAFALAHARDLMAEIQRAALLAGESADHSDAAS